MYTQVTLHTPVAAALADPQAHRLTERVESARRSPHARASTKLQGAAGEAAALAKAVVLSSGHMD